MNDALKIRPLVPGPDDEACLEITNRIAAEIPDTVPITREQLAAGRKFPNYDPHGRFVAEWNGKIVGTGFGIVHADDPERKGLLNVRVLPEFRRQRVGAALANAALQALHERGVTKVTGQAREGNIAANTFLRSHGFKLNRLENWMRRGLDRLPVGAGENTEVAISKLGDSDEDLQLGVSLMNEVFTGSIDFLPNTLETQRKESEAFASMGGIMWWFVARSGGELVGLVLTSFNPRHFTPSKKKQAFLMSLGVRESHRGRGIGKALLIRAMQGLKDCGIEEVELLVDDENPSPAIQIYLRLGFQVVRRILHYERAV